MHENSSSGKGDGGEQLTDKQELFVEFYLQTLNATEAVRLAGYSGSNSALAVIGHRNLKLAKIQERVDDRLAELKVENSDQIARIVEKQSDGQATTVYLIRAGNGLVKIGKTVDIAQRFKELNTSSPVELELIGIVQTDDATKIESALHARFLDKKVKGEWFALTSSDVALIESQYEVESETGFGREKRKVCIICGKELTGRAVKLCSSTCRKKRLHEYQVICREKRLRDQQKMYQRELLSRARQVYRVEVTELTDQVCRLELIRSPIVDESASQSRLRVSEVEPRV